MRTDKAQRLSLSNARDRKTVEWQQCQDRIRTRDGYTCHHCQRTTGILLHIHHRYYVAGRHYWDYPDKAFIALCEECHDREEDALFEAQHEIRKSIGWRNGEAHHMKKLADALDSISDKYSISEIIGAMEDFIKREDIFEGVVRQRKMLGKAK